MLEQLDIAMSIQKALCQFFYVAATLVAECISRQLKSPLHAKNDKELFKIIKTLATT